MRKTLFIVATLGLSCLSALADMPPPPDDYTGPTNEHIAGLSFTRQTIRTTILEQGPPPQEHPGSYITYVFLSDCDVKHPNCVEARKLGAIGGAVTEVNGKWIAADLSVVTMAFALAHGKPVQLTILPAEQAETPPDNPKTITFVAKPK